MVILIAIFTLMLISAALVIAAGILSSRLSEKENWVEIHEESETISPETEPYSVK